MWNHLWSHSKIATKQEMWCKQHLRQHTNYYTLKHEFVQRLWSSTTSPTQSSWHYRQLQQPHGRYLHLQHILTRTSPLDHDRMEASRVATDHNNLSSKLRLRIGSSRHAWMDTVGTWSSIDTRRSNPGSTAIGTSTHHGKSTPSTNHRIASCITQE